MLASVLWALQAFDLALLVAGGVIGLVYWRNARRSARAGAALLATSAAAARPGLVLGFTCLGLYYVAQLMAIGTVTIWYPASQVEQPASPAWYTANLATDGAKLVAAMVFAALLAPRPVRLERGAAARVVGMSAAGAWRYVLGGTLTILAATTAILAIVHPVLKSAGWDVPEHPVLIALREGTLPAAAVAQLAFGALVVAPLVEELLFRGVLLGGVLRATRDPAVAIVATGVAFGLVHAFQPQAVAPLAVMGMMLAYVRLRTGVLWPCVLVHTLFNGRTIGYTLLGVPIE